MDNHFGSHLSVVVDLSPAQWHRAAADRDSPLAVDAFVSQLLAFLNAHIALKHENSLAVFAAFPGKSVMLYASTDPPDRPTPIDPNSYPPFKRLDSTVTARITAQLAADIHPEEPSALVGAITKALCCLSCSSRHCESNLLFLPDINRLSLGHDEASDPRILVLSVSPDLATSYIPIMNSIFSAQKLKITIDACQIFGPDTVFLQQAAHLTGGSYLYLDRRDALLQYLIMSFLPPPPIRKVLAVPTQDRIDFRAACFCHKNIVDIGSCAQSAYPSSASPCPSVPPVEQSSPSKHYSVSMLPVRRPAPQHQTVAGEYTPVSSSSEWDPGHQRI
ncbi:transcription factor Tfb4-domain-containing protein [Gymnopilus junonius]|uniref:General transcription and DNA repair factor IIH subunit TFB4 n=1 Tax=Gymnopilus junonius TaxID=109634 RepID=A0A9P5NPL9_GYMJU|nr:transcription factor Tfb4-domain-containing protein [Gymnopilus junonius]